MSVLQMSISAAILLLGIFLIRPLIIRRLPKKVLVLLWSMVLLRLLVPFAISVDTPSRYLSSEEAHQHTFAPHMQATEMATGLHLSIAEMTLALNAAISSVVENISQNSALIVFWMVGSIILAMTFFITHFIRRMEYKKSLPAQSDFINRWLGEQNIRRHIQVRISDRIKAPLTYGIRKPIILLPKTTDWCDEAKLRCVLTHEITHIKQFDILTKWLLAIALCVHWFNPLIWVMYILANRDIELSCDETVVRTIGMDTKSAYALNLLELEENKDLFMPLVAGFARKPIEKRIVAIMQIKKVSVFGIMVAVLLMIGAGAVMAATSVYAGVSEHDTATISVYTGDYNSDELEAESIKYDEVTPENISDGECIVTTRHFAVAVCPQVSTGYDYDDICTTYVDHSTQGITQPEGYNRCCVICCERFLCE